MVAPITPDQGGKINDDVKGSATIRDGRIYTSDIADKQVTMDKLADEVTEAIEGGGGGSVVVQITRSGQDVEVDKLYDEIKEALDAGLYVYGVAPLGIYYQLTQISDYDVTFVNLTFMTTSAYAEIVTVGPTGANVQDKQWSIS